MPGPALVKASGKITAKNVHIFINTSSVGFFTLEISMKSCPVHSVLTPQRPLSTVPSTISCMYCLKCCLIEDVDAV